jgi:hypothetical protein
MKPNLVIACAPALLLSACHATTIDSHANAELADTRRGAEHAIDYATCADGSRFGPNCGLIMRIAASDDFRERFRAKVCETKAQAECDDAYRRMIDAEMARRYFAADRAEVARTCDLHAGTCDDGVAYERLLLGSHNRHVQAQYAEDEARIEAERTAVHRADADDAARAVVETMDLLGGGTVCHSYPSAFGGQTTVCGR